PWSFRPGPGAAYSRGISAGRSWAADLRCARFRFFCLSAGIFSARMFLARRIAIVEPLQQLRCSVSGAVEHHAALSTSFDLPASATELVAELLLFAAPVLGRAGHVFSGASLDGESARCLRRGAGV